MYIIINMNKFWLIDWLILATERPLKYDEKCFLFHLNSSSCSQNIQIFCLEFWSRWKRYNFNFKICDVTTWLENKIHILTNISRSKSNQTMKFGQLIEYNMKNISLGKSYTKWGGDSIPRPFSKKSKSSITLDQQSKVLYSLFFIVYHVEDYQNN